MVWVRRGSALAALALGWFFILFQNHFHLTPPTVFLCLAFFAVVAAIYTLFRTGAFAATANDEETDEASWGKPLGALAELEREKRTLLKAIKEAEFDLQMGKLSKQDAERMIAVYRARAIDVIKEIDVQNTASGSAGTVRERILREARARIEVETKAAGKPKKDDKKSEKQKRADKLADAVAASTPKADANKSDAAADKPAAKADDEAGEKLRVVEVDDPSGKMTAGEAMAERERVLAAEDADKKTDAKVESTDASKAEANAEDDSKKTAAKEATP